MGKDEILYYIWLSGIKGIGPIIGRRLICKLGSPEVVFNSNLDELLKVEGIGKEIGSSIFNNKDLHEAEKILEVCKEKNIGISVYNDDIFPGELNKYEDSPIIIYYSGKLCKELKGVGIVGTRRCSEYGKNITIEAASYLGSKEIPVISGLAKGIDGYAHTACLKASGFTVAVIASGIDICYPNEHKRLMEKIKETGLLLSEYPPGTPTRKDHFPKRNRLISSLSEKILIVEAGEKSGALITADYSKTKGKEIYSAPNNIYMKEFIGSNKLIEDGAKIYLRKEQLYIDYKIKKKQTIESEIKKQVANYNDAELKILDLLKDNSYSIDEIMTLTNVDKNELLNDLFNLELLGIIENIAGVYRK